MTIQSALMYFALSYLGCFLIFLPKLWIRKFKELKEVSIVLAIICGLSTTSIYYMINSDPNNIYNTTTKSTESATSSR